jgi:hypothetical protein
VSYEDKKKITRTYDELVNYGYISIPVDMLNSWEEEDKWLKLNVYKLIEGLHQVVLKSKVFELKVMPKRIADRTAPGQATAPPARRPSRTRCEVGATRERDAGA